MLVINNSQSDMLTNMTNQSTSSSSNRNFIHFVPSHKQTHNNHHSYQHHRFNKFLAHDFTNSNKTRLQYHHHTGDGLDEAASDEHIQQTPIFINQPNTVYILAKYGQTVNLPCIIYRQNTQDLTSVTKIASSEMKRTLFWCARR